MIWDDWNYLLTMRRLKQMESSPKPWKIEVPIHWGHVYQEEGPYDCPGPSQNPQEGP